jgi:ABC-2 type transport system ATP-binding protein
VSGPALEISGLVKRYGGRAVVDGLELTVERGTVTALLGPNGAGKTTSVEIACGLRRADAGSVRVLGLDPERDRAALMPRLGVMLQAGGVYSGANAREMLRHVAALHSSPLEPDGLLEQLGLADTGRTTFRRLSGGQQRLLALGLAIVGRPEFVFLDEPTANLDPHARRATWELIAELRADGVTVLLATHHLDEAERLSDHVHIVDRGRLVRSGTPAELTAAGGTLEDVFLAVTGERK